MRFDKALQILEPKIIQLEDRSDQPARALRDHDRVRFSQSLKSSGEIRPLAQNLIITRRSRSDKITHDHKAGGNAQPHLKRLPALHEPDRLDHCQAGAHGLLRIVLIGVRVTEVDEDAVAHTTADKATEPGHDLGNALLVGADHLLKVFDVKMHGERR